MRSEAERLQDIQEAITRIERYAQRGRTAFESDELVQVWIIHHLQIIGESASKISVSFHQAHPEIPWAQIIAMLNILIHDYFGNEVWAVIEKDLPDLKQKIGGLK
jgi:uncharacterized protein with HEPN domain